MRERRPLLGFTLMELLTVVAIIATLAAIIFPVLTVARRKAMEAPCTSNLRNLWLALDMYCDAGRGWLDCPRHLSAIQPLASDKRIFLCPADARPSGRASYPEAIEPSDLSHTMLVQYQISYHYIRHHEPASEDITWPSIVRVHSNLALLVCPWHGQRLSYPGSQIEPFPFFAGKMLHVRLDGSICRSPGWPQPTDGATSLFNYLYAFMPDETPEGCR